jgi:hypothetical protein
MYENIEKLGKWGEDMTIKNSINKFIERSFGRRANG